MPSRKKSSKNRKASKPKPSSTPQWRIPVECMEQVIETYHKKTIDDETISLIPLLQSCPTILNLGLPHLYSTITLSSPESVISFLTLPNPSSYFLTNSIHITGSSAEFDRPRVKQLVQEVRGKVMKVKRSEKVLKRWTGEEEVMGAEGLERADGQKGLGWIRGVIFVVDAGCLSVMYELAHLFLTQTVLISWDDFCFDETADVTASAETCIRELTVTLPVNLRAPDVLLLPPPEIITGIFNTPSYRFHLPHWPVTDPEEEAAVRARGAMAVCVYLVEREEVEEVIFDCGEEHFFCAGGGGTKYEKITLDCCKEGECPLKGRESAHPHAKKINEIMRDEANPEDVYLEMFLDGTFDELAEEMDLDVWDGDDNDGMWVSDDD